MDRYICIHGHFYQPPRENPWLEAIELQESAYPYHDWNERITAECYAPNALARILDAKGYISRIINNYSRISFNMGPTLLGWMETKAPECYRGVLEADAASRERFGGHGSALAQVYNHMIMPLAHRRDKLTQIIWGIRDFERRFGRQPEGMWLAETAADLESLDLLAMMGVDFTILAPRQARRIRPIGQTQWQSVEGERIDPTRTYLAQLPSGRKISLFFYDGPVSRGIAFEGLLGSGDRFAQRLTGLFSNARNWPQLVHVATDGESYGHHHRYGEMALAYALDQIDRQEGVRLTNYGQFLELHPPTHEVEIFENSSWSCVHGVERWRSDCGCNSGGNPGWRQGWRGPLRKALDDLRDAVAPRFEEEATHLLRDPWTARNDYIEVVLDRSRASIERFFRRHGRRPLTENELIRALKLLELQRHAMLMYTSCGWFFDDISGIETVQVIQYAARVIQLARQTLDLDLEADFLKELALAKSNAPGAGDGARIYERLVRPMMVDLPRVGAHYAVNSLFVDYLRHADVYCYEADQSDYRRLEAGKARLALGRVQMHSRITLKQAMLVFGVLHMGDHNLYGGVSLFRDDESYRALVEEAGQIFGRADLPAVMRFLDRHFAGSTYSIDSLFKDEQRRVLTEVLSETVAEAEQAYCRLYNDNASLMRFLAGLGLPLPKAFLTTAEFAFNTYLRSALGAETLDAERAGQLLAEAAQEQVALDTRTLEFTLRQTLESAAEDLFAKPEDPARLGRLEEALRALKAMPFDVNLWKVQNLYFELIKQAYPRMVRRSKDGDAEARNWVERFEKIGETLHMRVAMLNGA